MKTIQASDIQLAFSDHTVLKNVQLTLTTKSRAALTGGNGSGKSTLMKIISGDMHPDMGTIAVQKGTRASYLPQSGKKFSGNSSLYQEAETAFSELHLLVDEKEQIGNQLSKVTSDDKYTQNLLERQHDIEERLLTSDYYNREKEIEQVLIGLGFTRADFQKNCEQFSGGWQMRIALAKILLEHPDILLLDEPTNYLDLEARNWLEDFLRNYQGGFLIVSHDRFFLDSTVDETYELFMGSLRRYPGNYSAYQKRREQEIVELQQQYERQQEEIARVNAFVQKFRYNASKASQVQSRIKYLEKLEPIELPQHMQKIHFSFPPAPHSGKKALELKDISKSYGPNTVLNNLSLEVQRGEKLVVTGVNGAGKSTLLRIIADVDSQYQGEVRYGAGVTAGYFSQEQRELEESPRSIIDLFEAEAPTELVPKLRNLLGAFLFQGDDIYKPIKVLSGGERSRIALLRLLLQPHNLLILDEPTNHLDIHSKDVLLEALKKFAGTLVFVSHDRYFIEHLATRVLELGTEGPRNFSGDYQYYLYRLEKEAAQDEHTETSSSTPPEAAAPSFDMSSVGYEELKQQKKRQRKLEAEEQKLVGMMEELEQEHSRIQADMALPEVYSQAEKITQLQKRLNENEQEQTQLSEQWEAIALEKESLAKEAQDR
ncbi:MAG: ABC-F family ATP-binding cassette domain-containing protein [Spirochaetia bacterium]|nr:ABC-F family ATP-binding cassette domain-containing protein [Spirochaetia bacterium]